MKNPKFQLFKGRGSQFRFRLKAGNGQIILTSEGYTSKAGAKNGIDSVKSNGKKDGRYERLMSRDGQHYFTLSAANNEVIGRSERYTTKSAMERGIKSVKKNCSAPVEDTTA